MSAFAHLSQISSDESAPPVEILRPARQSTPLILASPHSGADYPDRFVAASRLDPIALRGSEDAFVDALFEAAPSAGVPLLRARFPRAYVDPNREPYELDPEMFDRPLPSWVNTRSPRVMGGLGTIARVVANGAEIYAEKLSTAEIESRLSACYRPYHDALSALIDETKGAFGRCVLIDCHSMPSVGGPMDDDRGRHRVDFVIGDRFGRSCGGAISNAVAEFLGRCGYRVERNIPYAGGFTTAHYGRPESGVEALQIEINRALYMDEDRIVPSPGLAVLADRMAKLIAHLVACLSQDGTDR